MKVGLGSSPEIMEITDLACFGRIRLLSPDDWKTTRSRSVTVHPKFEMNSGSVRVSRSADRRNDSVRTGMPGCVHHVS